MASYVSPRKLPEDAFAFYLSLGPGRSYQAVAERFQVSKQSVSKHAVREQWQHRLAHINSEAKGEIDKHCIESVVDMHRRHLVGLRKVYDRALKALEKYEFKSAAEASKALYYAIKLEERLRYPEVLSWRIFYNNEKDSDLIPWRDHVAPKISEEDTREK